MVPGKPEDIHRHHYYGPLINHYAKSILKSRMLLDEDLEVFLKEYNSSDYPEEVRYKPPCSTTASVASLLFSVHLSKKFGSLLLFVPSLIITAKLVFTEVQLQKKRSRDKKIIHEIIEAIRENRALNANIFRYIKVRTDLDSNSDKEFFTAFNKNTEEFMTTFTKAEFNFAKTTIDILSRISAFSEELTEDYNCLKHLDVETSVNPCSVRNIYDCKNITKTIGDIHIYMTSKLLGYLGIILCSPVSKLDKENFELFLNVRLPHILSVLRNHTQFVKNQFSSLQNSVVKILDYKYSRSSETKNVSNKLRTTLINSINNLQVILEKSQGILQKLDNDETRNNVAIDKALLDVKDHTLATYESLDLLCRLYGILANAPIVANRNTTLPDLSRRSDVSKTKVVSCDDEIEAKEEKYEFYLDKDDEDDICVRPERSYEDPSKAYLSLMLRELKQSLKKHERFIEAKKRRGSAAENEHEVEASENIPSFNLRKLDVSTMAANVQEDSNPQPPPLPNFNLATEFSRSEFQTFNNKALLDDVVALSRQRNQEEVIFGDSDTESDDSS